MNKNQLLAGCVIALALILGVFNTFKSSTVIQEVTKQFGGTSPDIASPYLSVGGITLWYSHTDSLTQATTTICALQSPAATSTLVFSSLHINVSSSTSNTFTFAKSATPYATTTSLGSSVIASGLEVNLASSTNSGATYLIFSPNTYFVVGQAGNNAGATNSNFSETGTCQAEWRQLSY